MIMGATDMLKEIGGVVNTTVVLHCNATGHPAPVISWLRDGQPLHTDLQHHISEDGTQLQVGLCRLSSGRRRGSGSNWPVIWLRNNTLAPVSAPRGPGFRHGCVSVRG